MAKTVQYHIDCYNRKNGGCLAGSRSKFDGQKCAICGGTLKQGDMITWQRKFKDNGRPEDEPKPLHQDYVYNPPTPNAANNFDALVDKYKARVDDANAKRNVYDAKRMDAHEAIARYDMPNHVREGIANAPDALHDDLDVLMAQHEQEKDDERDYVLPTPTPVLNAVNHVAVQDNNPLLAIMAQQLAPYLQGMIQSASLVNEKQVKALIESMVGGMVLKTVTEVNIRKFDPIEQVEAQGVQHFQFSLLLDCMQARYSHNGMHLNVWLAGPTGSGKTTAAKNAATALGKRFAFCGALETKYDVFGFFNAQGQVVNTEFRDYYLNGGCFLGDEQDSWHPSASLAMNACLANEYACFPDGTLPRSKDFCFIACANTWGLGATNDYVGRNKLDAAYLDRFAAKVDWQYDEGMELAISPNVAWTKRVQEIRTVAKSKGVKIIVSPRKSLDGAALLATGIPQRTVEMITFGAGLTAEQSRMLGILA